MLGFAEPYVNCISFREQARHLSTFQTLAKLGTMPIHVHPYQQDKWDFGPAFEGVFRPHMIVQNGRVRESAPFQHHKR